MIAMPAYRQAFLIRQAGLLDVDIDIADRSDDAQRIVHEPAGVGIGDEPVARLQHGPNRVDTVDVLMYVAAHFELKAAITLGPVARDTLGHCLGRLLRNRAVEGEIVAEPAAE